MSVRFKIALTIFITGALTAFGVIATVLDTVGGLAVTVAIAEKFNSETTEQVGHRARPRTRRAGAGRHGCLRRGCGRDPLQHRQPGGGEAAPV